MNEEDEKRELRKRMLRIDARVNTLLKDTCKGRSDDGLPMVGEMVSMWNHKVTNINETLINLMGTLVISHVLSKIGAFRKGAEKPLDKLKEPVEVDTRINAAIAAIKSEVGDMNDELWDEAERNASYVLKNLVKKET